MTTPQEKTQAPIIINPEGRKRLLLVITKRDDETASGECRKTAARSQNLRTEN
jgi:hypothetical protein